jgi:hypothetical protein
MRMYVQKLVFSAPTDIYTFVCQKHIIIRITRSGEQKYLTLTPRQGWGGRGMLGYAISLPLEGVG